MIPKLEVIRSAPRASFTCVSVALRLASTAAASHCPTASRRRSVASSASSPSSRVLVAWASAIASSPAGIGASAERMNSGKKRMRRPANVSDFALPERITPAAAARSDDRSAPSIAARRLDAAWDPGIGSRR